MVNGRSNLVVADGTLDTVCLGCCGIIRNVVYMRSLAVASFALVIVCVGGYRIFLTVAVSESLALRMDEGIITAYTGVSSKSARGTSRSGYRAHGLVTESCRGVRSIGIAAMAGIYGISAQSTGGCGYCRRVAVPCRRGCYAAAKYLVTNRALNTGGNAAHSTGRIDRGYACRGVALCVKEYRGVVGDKLCACGVQKPLAASTYVVLRVTAV